jgi:hypothetical protein
MIVIYVGDVGEYLCSLACSVDPCSQLITQDNFRDLQSGTYYTSIGDFSDLNSFGLTLQQANKIIFAPPNKWSDEVKTVSLMRNWTEDYLKVFDASRQVENYSPKFSYNQTTILSLADRRKTQDKQLWIAGCSVSHGVGVTHNTRYGQLLATQLNREASFLTQSGSSIIWAADQILRSDIYPGDIVVWGLTSSSRVPYYDNNFLNHVNAYALKVNDVIKSKITPDHLTSDDLFYRTLTSVFQVINFCQKINATLVIASVLDDSIVSYIKDHSNLIMLYKMWGRDPDNLCIDLGSDGEHPGIKTHQFYADQIYQKIQHILAKN